MSVAGDVFVRCCDSLHGIPARLICLCLLLLQSAIINYYLITYIGKSHYAWITFDAVIIFVFIASFIISSKQLCLAAKSNGQTNAIAIGWLAWLVYATALVARMVLILDKFGHKLDEKDFFGPSTLKTALALASCVFLFLLMTHHDAVIGSDCRRYIEELTGTIIFDLFDTVDIIEVLFDKDARDLFTPGMQPAILAISACNILIPTIPLITLSITGFGRRKMSKRFVSIHKLAVTLIINVPNLVIRLALWHGFSVGISPFIMKNIILIGIVMYEFYEHKKEKVEEHERESKRKADPESNNDLRENINYNQSFEMNERI